MLIIRSFKTNAVPNLRSVSQRDSYQIPSTCFHGSITNVVVQVVVSQ